MSFCIRAFRVFAFFSLFLCICVFLCLWFCVCNTRQHISLQRNVGKQPLHKKVLMDGKNSWARGKKVVLRRKLFLEKKKEEREMRDRKSICHRLPPDIRHLLPPDVHFKEVCVSLAFLCSVFPCLCFLWSCVCDKRLLPVQKTSKKRVYAVKALYIM